MLPPLITIVSFAGPDNARPPPTPPAVLPLTLHPLNVTVPPKLCNTSAAPPAPAAELVGPPVRLPLKLHPRKLTLCLSARHDTPPPACASSVRLFEKVQVEAVTVPRKMFVPAARSPLSMLR